MTSVAAVALGYQGFGNVGDEAILAGIEELLDGSPIVVRVVIGGDRSQISAMRGARRVTSRRLLPTPAGLRALRAGRVLLLAGGGLIHDHWPIVIPRYLLWAALARALGLRIAWVAIGVGPIRRRWARWLAGIAARLAHVITVRDETSLTVLRGAWPAVQASVVPDPAYFLPRPVPVARTGLAIILRRPVPGQEAMAPRLASVLGAQARERLAHGGLVELVTMEPGYDEEFAATVASLASRDGRGPHVRALSPDPQRALAELAGFEEAISVRLHGLILCAVAGTPCVPIVYDDKVAAAAEDLGLAGVALPLDGLTIDRLAAALGDVRQDRVASSVEARVEAIRAERARAARLIASVLDA